jgi:hypothetical protein
MIATATEPTDQFERTERTLVASGTSCTEQMSALFAREITHPVELIAPDERW